MKRLLVFLLLPAAALRVQAQTIEAPAREVPRIIRLGAPLSPQTPAKALGCPTCGLFVPGQPAIPSSVDGPVPALPPLVVDLAREGQSTTRLFTLDAAAARETAIERETALAATREVKPALVASVRLGEWRGPGTTLSQPCCGDAAPKLALVLRHMGLPVDVIEAEMHYYALWRLADGDVVIDPTIRQFFGGPRAPPSVPEIFVGSRVDLHALFQKHAAAKTTKYDVDRIYFKAAGTRNAKISELQNNAAGRPDLAPLSRFIAARRPGLN